MLPGFAPAVIASKIKRNYAFLTSAAGTALSNVSFANKPSGKRLLIVGVTQATSAAVPNTVKVTPNAGAVVSLPVALSAIYYYQGNQGNPYFATAFYAGYVPTGTAFSLDASGSGGNPWVCAWDAAGVMSATPFNTISAVQTTGALVVPDSGIGLMLGRYGNAAGPTYTGMTLDASLGSYPYYTCAAHLYSPVGSATATIGAPCACGASWK